MRRLLIVLCLVMVLMSGCSNKENVEYLYKGSNGDWHAELLFEAVVHTYEEDGKLFIKNEHTEKVNIWYAGSMEIADVDQITYVVTTKTGSSSSYVEHPDSFDISLLSGGNGAMLLEDEVITVEIHIDDQIVSLTLVHVNR